jgi:O-antigen/teichoic acid export membrane protein
VSAVDDDRRKVSRAIAWVGLASGIVGALDAITLAILLWMWVTPEQFGIATLAVTLFFLLDLITDAGLSSVLIQRESVDDDTISSVFWLNVIVTFGAFVVMLGLGPLVGYIQGHPIVGWMLIIYGTKLLYQNVYFIPAALLRREMRFKELSIVRTVANAGEMIAKIGFAAAGEPIWCFVAGPLTRVFITGVGLQICRPWRPRRVFRTDGARAMLSFGFKTTGSQFLQHFYNNISHQIVGFYFSEAALAAYRIAYEIVLYPINWVSNVVAQVAFPALARLRGNPEALSAQFLQFSRQNLAVAVPILVLLLVAAEDFIALVFPTIGDVALPVRVLCIVGLLRAIDCLYLPLLDAMGLAGRNVVVAGLAAVVLTTGDVVFALTLGDQLGFTAVAVGRTIGYPLVIIVHARMALGPIALPARRYVGHLIGIVGCGCGAVAVGLVIQELLPGMSAGISLATAGGGALLVLAVLLAKTQGLGIRRMIKEQRR